MRYDNGGTLKDNFVQISQTLQKTKGSAGHIMSQRLGNVVLFLCKAYLESMAAVLVKRGVLGRKGKDWNGYQRA
jgi:hypothetical protein